MAHDTGTRYAPRQYRHLPTVVEAIRFDGTAECARAVVEWGRARTGNTPFRFDHDDLEALTPQGPRYVPDGWLAVLGVVGEPYSVSPEVEALAYIEVGDPGFATFLVPDRLDEIAAQAAGTSDPGKLRELVAVVVASHKVLSG